MSYTFTLTTQPTTPFLKKLQTILVETQEITSEKSYNALITHVINLAKQYPLPKNQGSLFAKELKEGTKDYPLSESTPWGGVPLKQVNVDKDYIRKLLVVKQYGILGFEIHKQKLEKLKVLEGMCLLISSQHERKNWEKGRVSIQLGKPVDKVTLQPGDEHGIIALTNCVIEEESTNHLTDLTYIFQASQVR
jgi:hypothetical protein